MTEWNEITIANLNNLKENSKIDYFDRILTDEQTDEDGKYKVYTAILKNFVLTKQTKFEMFKEVTKARAEGMRPPYIILVPKKLFVGKIKNLTYPIPFRGNNFYIVPHLRDILVYEVE